MASAQWNKDFYDLKTHTARLPENMRDEAKKIVSESAKEGASRMYELVDRIDTELMRGSVSYEDAKTTPSSVYAKFGWGLHGADVEPYFVYQEQGFTHAGSGTDVPPMHALLRAFMEVREKFYARVKAAVK